MNDIIESMENTLDERERLYEEAERIMAELNSHLAGYLGDTP